MNAKKERINGVLRSLTRWAAHQKAWTSQVEALRELTGADYDSKLWLPICALWEDYTSFVSAEVGDEGEWLAYFENECQMGAHPTVITLDSKRKLRLSTLRDLATLLVRTPP